MKIPTDEQKTFNQWSELGYKIKKGSKGTKINGEFFFSQSQVESPKSIPYYSKGMRPPPGGREESYDVFEAYDLENPLEENHYGQW